MLAGCLVKWQVTSCQLCEGKAIRERQLKHLIKLNRITNAWIKNVSLAFAKLLVSCRFSSVYKK